MHESPRRYFRVLSSSHEIAESPGTVKVAGAFVLPMQWIQKYPRWEDISQYPPSGGKYDSDYLAPHYQNKVKISAALENIK